MRLVSLALLAAFALAPVAATAGPAEDLAGVWKHRFDNALVSGEEYRSEDILEVVPYGTAGAAYVRLHLEFYNGHICDLAGVARAVGPDRLVYAGPRDFEGRPCTLTVSKVKGGVRLYEDENGACRSQTCGARGGYGYGTRDSEPDFADRERRAIRYLPRILASTEYKEAVKAFTSR